MEEIDASPANGQQQKAKFYSQQYKTSLSFQQFLYFWASQFIKQL
jgi:hypothetical protein